VIHPRSSGDNADKECVSAASFVPSSFVASGGAAAPVLNSFPMKLVKEAIPALHVQAQPLAIPSPRVGTALRHF
jgi:hypothetical protein